MNNPEEKDAVLKFIGTMFGQAKKIDQSVVERSSNLNSIHQTVQRAFEQELRSPVPPPVIHPTQAEVIASGVIPPPVPPGYTPGGLPTVQPVPDVVPPVQVAQPFHPDSGFQMVVPPHPPLPLPSVESMMPTSWQREQVPNSSHSNIEVVMLLNTILDKLKIIELRLENGQTTTRKPKSTRSIPGRSAKDK